MRVLIFALLALLGTVSVASVCDLKVTIDGRPIMLEEAYDSAFPLNQTWPGYERPRSQSRKDWFCRFDLIKPCSFRVQIPAGVNVSDIRIRPLSRGGLVFEDGCICVQIDRSEKLVIEFGQGFPQLHVFADSPYEYHHSDNEIYFGAGVHDVGLISPTNGQTVCIDAGAVVYGAIRIDCATNVVITGRGILDSSRIRRVSTDGRYLRKLTQEDKALLRDVTQFFCRKSENVRVEGIVFRDSPFWTMIFRDCCKHVIVDNVKIVGQWRYNSDGIDICGCEDVVVRNSFIRSFDDSVVVRDGGRDENGMSIPSRRITCENTLLWCDWGGNVKAQLTGTKNALIEDVIVTNCVFANVQNTGIIVAARPGGINGIIRNVRVEDIEYNLSTPRYWQQRQSRDNPEELFVPKKAMTLQLFNICNYGYDKADVSKYSLLYDNIAFKRFRVLGQHGSLTANVSLDAGKEEVRDLITEDLPAGIAWTRNATITSSTNEMSYLKRKWREDLSDATTGLDANQLKCYLTNNVPLWQGEYSWVMVKAKAFAYLCDNTAIDVSGQDWFPTFARWTRHTFKLHPLLDILNSRCNNILSANVPKNFNGGSRWGGHLDFDHSAPDWDDILKLGFVGMAERLRNNYKKQDYYESRMMAADSVLRLLDRLVAQADKRLSEQSSGVVSRRRLECQAASLRRLRDGAPKTVLDALNFIYLYWVVSENFEGIQVRTLGNLDRLISPYYHADMAAGRTTEAEFREQLVHFWWQWGSIDNYWGQPVYFGGTTEAGGSEYNDVSCIMLEIHDMLALPTPKLHMKIGKSTPDWVWNKALDMVRRQRSISFIGEESHWRVIKSLGYNDQQARDFMIWGCYEWAIKDSANDTFGAAVNLLKPIEDILTDSVSKRFRADTFDEFKTAYLSRLRRNVGNARTFASVKERWMTDVNPSLMFSLSSEYSVKTGKDAFSGGVQNGNNTAIWMIGIGSAVDALMAVKELVYETGLYTLGQLGGIMQDDWKGHDDLRTRMCRSKRKWGNNDVDANRIGRELLMELAKETNGRPNSRGGVFKASGHTARWHLSFGRYTGATPDGRKRGDEMSKNISPTMGADTEGVTALLNTMASLDACNLPGDFPLDVALLPSTVTGEKGEAMMRAIIESYFANGGLVIQFNIHDPKTLRDAQKHPDKYGNLQVRVCGWNVRWNDMPKVEQDKFILRAEMISQ